VRVKDRVRSHSEDDIQILVEYFQFLDLLPVVLVEVAVGEVQPLQVLQAQQYLSHYFRRDLVGHHAQPLQLRAVLADRQEAVLRHAGGADEELLDLLEVPADHVAALLLELRPAWGEGYLAMWSTLS
jgi:hypothetical protein